MMTDHINPAKFPAMPRTQEPKAPSASQHMALASIFPKLASMHADRAIKQTHVSNIRPNMVGEANPAVSIQ